MRPSRLLGLTAGVLLVFGIAGSLFIAYDLLSASGTLNLTPSYHVDIGTTANDATSTGNSYVE